MSRRLSYWPCGGEIVVAHGRTIAIEDAHDQRGLHLREASIAAEVGDHRACATAFRLAMELRQALEAHARWRRAAKTSYGQAA